MTSRPQKRLYFPAVMIDNILAFDIETAPDTAAGARLYGLDGLADDDIARAMATLRLQKTGGDNKTASDFLPLHLHRVVAISAVYRARDSVKIWSLGAPDAGEGDLIAAFYDGLERRAPTLVSWNGGGFDLPVLHYRSLLHGVTARRYWEIGDEEREFKYNNYLNRFHWRHIDLMDALANYNLRAAAPLDEIAVLLGLPGKMGLGGRNVGEAYRAGQVGDIRNYCEIDALNTYLIYLNWEVVRGNLDGESYARECKLVKSYLVASDKKHFGEFAAAWEQTGGEV